MCCGSSAAFRQLFTRSFVRAQSGAQSFERHRCGNVFSFPSRTRVVPCRSHRRPCQRTVQLLNRRPDSQEERGAHQPVGGGGGGGGASQPLTRPSLQLSGSSATQGQRREHPRQHQRARQYQWYASSRALSGWARSTRVQAEKRRSQLVARRRPPRLPSVVASDDALLRFVCQGSPSTYVCSTKIA
jgi:hypothetical protein